MAKTYKMITKDIEALLPYVNNSRTHSKDQIKQIAASINEFGFTNPVLIDGDNMIIAGHGRVMAAQLLNMTDVPCIVLDGLSDAQKKAYVIADNKLALNAGWDEQLLANEIAALKEEEFDIDLLGFDDEELEELLKEEEMAIGLTEDDDIPEPPTNPVTIDGDIWLLGKHRLMCGDSTDSGAVALLMDGIKADMVFTDPPYGVNYTEKADRLAKNKKYNKISNDKDVKTAENVCDGAFKSLSENIKSGGSYYVCAPQGGDQMMMMMMMMMMMDKNGIRCRHELIWVKPSPVFSMNRLDYDYQHEPILYGWKDNHKFIGQGEHTKSIWKIDREKNTGLHPTMKPVALVENAILNSSKTEDIILDLFGGSGTTIIASEKNKRVARLMELDPVYCDVIINRWQDYTGGKATHVSTGKTFEEMTNERHRPD